MLARQGQKIQSWLVMMRQPDLPGCGFRLAQDRVQPCMPPHSFCNQYNVQGQSSATIVTNQLSTNGQLREQLITMPSHATNRFHPHQQRNLQKTLPQ